MDSLEHSAKGTSWKKHKYIRIENGRQDAVNQA